MPNLFCKYIKYLPPLLYLAFLMFFGIPEVFYVVDIVFVYEYHILFGSIYLLAFLEDFFNINEKAGILIRLITLIILIVLLITAILYKSIFSFIFSIILLVAFSFELYFQNKKNKKSKQQD